MNCFSVFQVLKFKFNFSKILCKILFLKFNSKKVENILVKWPLNYMINFRRRKVTNLLSKRKSSNNFQRQFWGQSTQFNFGQSLHMWCSDGNKVEKQWEKIWTLDHSRRENEPIWSPKQRNESRLLKLFIP